MWTSQPSCRTQPNSSTLWRGGRRASDCGRPDRLHDCVTGRLEAIEHESYGHGALADGGRHPLDRPAADIADTEDSGPARLETTGTSSTRCAADRKGAPWCSDNAALRRGPDALSSSVGQCLAAQNGTPADLPLGRGPSTPA